MVRCVQMAANYLPYDPQQMLLLPEALQEWLPEGHLAHFISDAVDGLDLRGCRQNDLRCQSGREDTRFGQPDPSERGPV